MIKKIVMPGFVETWHKSPSKAFAEITITDDWNLSIHGVIGPRADGNCAGSAGQCIDDIRNCKPAPGWTEERVQRFCDIWDEWHLNDMRPYCKHQKELGWDIMALEPVEEPSPTAPNRMTTRGWVYCDQKHPFGLLCKPCPVCGYEYGTSWLREEIPQDVIDWLISLPDSKVKPAWI